MAEQRRRGGGGRRKPPPRDDDREPTLGNPGADPARIHREYVERRVGGGEEPTPERYARARAQFRRLPGAVSAPPGEDAGEAEDDAPPAGGGDGPEPGAGEPGSERR